LLNFSGKETLDLANFIFVQTGQRGALPLDTQLFADIEKFLVLQSKIFRKRVDPYSHVLCTSQNDQPVRGAHAR